MLTVIATGTCLVGKFLIVGGKAKIRKSEIYNRFDLEGQAQLRKRSANPR
jgi:hypothetical protein